MPAACAVELVAPGGTEGRSLLPQGWSRLVSLLDGRGERDPVGRAERLCRLCVHSLGVSGAALGLGTDGNRTTVCATDEVSNRLEDLQITFSEGPCFDALGHGTPVLAPDLADGPEARRWPWFASAAVAVGAHAYFSLPLQVGAIRMGVLSLYRAAPGELTTEQLDDALVLADAAMLLMTIADRDPTGEAFRWALDDRSRFRAEVHQAVGVLMVRLGLPAADAFARLCAHAYMSDTPIAELAADVVSGRVRLTRDMT
jgi:hypothetical protein